LRINTRRIIPKTVPDGIVINIPDRTLYYFRDKKLEQTLPVGLGMKKNTPATTWQTPTGKFRITSKVKDPTWFVPPSIQKEMKEKGRTVKQTVPPGNKNPLGKYALKTSLSGILIHSTIFPASIYGFNSHGCIRVLPQNMERFFQEIKVNTRGEIIYQPVKIAFSDDGRVFLEVHRDIYDRYKSLDDVAKGLIVKNNAEKMVDWERVKASIRSRKGIPEDVTSSDAHQPIKVGRN
jgi:L,D-transpeptidase ErfK/SrfK